MGPPTRTRTGSRMISAADRITSGDVVAEKNSVWRVGGSAATIFFTSGQNPMSSMRSASSSTSAARWSNRKPPYRMWSIRRPGVATTTSTPASSARVCGPMSTPP